MGKSPVHASERLLRARHSHPGLSKAIPALGALKVTPRFLQVAWGSAQETWDSSTHAWSSACPHHMALKHSGHPKAPPRQPRPCSVQDERNSTEMNGCLRAHGVM